MNPSARPSLAPPARPGSTPRCFLRRCATLVTLLTAVAAVIVCPASAATNGGVNGGGTLDPGPRTPPGTTGPLPSSGGVADPGPTHLAPTENLTKVANAFTAKFKSVSLLISLRAGLRLTAPVEVSVLFGAERVTQDYVEGGIHVYHHFDLLDGHARQEMVYATLTERTPAGAVSYTVHWNLPVEPLFDVAISGLRFDLLSNGDWHGASECEIHWWTPTGEEEVHEVDLHAGEFHWFGAFRTKLFEVAVADNLQVPVFQWFEKDPWALGGNFTPPVISNGPLLTGAVGKRIFSFDLDDAGSGCCGGDDCTGHFWFTVTVDLRRYEPWEL